jgi:choline dehydrogenase-like flavoprotein
MADGRPSNSDPISPPPRSITRDSGISDSLFWRFALDRQPGNKEFDAIVVGSGPAGATIARELSKRKKRVLILERGGNAPVKEGSPATASILNVVSVSDNLVAPRAFTTGGTTALYFAVADFPPLDIFRSLGIDLSRELEEAKRELPLSVLPDELLGAQSIRLRQSAMELGYRWSKSTMLVDLAKCASGYRSEAKWNARSYVQEALENAATLINRAKVLKVLFENDRAIGVEYELRKAKKEVEVRQAFGTKIILAAGGAASPILLRDSGIKSVMNGGFYCHPSFGLFGLVSGLKAGDSFVGSMGQLLEDNIGVGDGNFPRAFYRMFMLSHRRLIRAFRHSRSIGVLVMVKEGPGGGLQEDGRYYKQFTQEDVSKLKRGEQIARRILRHAGAKHIFKSTPAASHIGGSIRIKEHLDENLQTEYRNLHVCDGSVIPGNVRIAPTFTLICLGKYLANRLWPIV